MENKVEHKVCTKCDVKKLISEFPFRNDTNSYRNRCKICFSNNNKNYRLKNSEKLKIQKREYVKINKDIINLKARKVYNINKDEINKIKRKNYSETGKEKKIKYYNSIKNNQEYKIKTKKWRKNWILNPINKAKSKEYQKKYKKEKKLTDPFFKFKKNIRGLIRGSFFQKGLKKNNKTETILGCTFKEFKTYIESKWQPWMNWKNRGNWDGYPNDINISWDIDHIIPLCTTTTEEEIIKLNHYTNLQPLCSYINRHVKGNNI